MTERIEPNIRAIERKTVAIVWHDEIASPAPNGYRHPLFQVTIDPAAWSPSGKYIRFGAEGDELVGWMDADAIHVEEVLAVEDYGLMRSVPKTIGGVTVSVAA